MGRHFLLTGQPGCGKTTAVRSIVARLAEEAPGLSVRGFWTEEIREQGVRVGFGIETVSGAVGTLARAGLASPYRVGRYGVDRESFESVAVAELEGALEQAARGHAVVVVIDEIGKMELFSERFRQVVRQAFSAVPHVVATIMQRPHPFADELKARADVTLIVVTPGNRDRLAAEIAAQLL